MAVGTEELEILEPVVRSVPVLVVKLQAQWLALPLGDLRLPGLTQFAGQSRGLWVCRTCQRQTSATAGTLLAGTRTPLTSWFAAIWQLTNQKHGMSALGLQRLLGLGSYETAWAHLHKLRRAMLRPGRELLSDTVEVDEAYVGGREEGVAGRQTADKSIVICPVEVR